MLQLKVRSYGICPEGRGEGTVEGRVFMNYYKGHTDKTEEEGGNKGGRGVWLGLGGAVGGHADNSN